MHIPEAYTQANCCVHTCKREPLPHAGLDAVLSAAWLLGWQALHITLEVLWCEIVWCCMLLWVACFFVF